MLDHVHNTFILALMFIRRKVNYVKRETIKAHSLVVVQKSIDKKSYPTNLHAADIYMWGTFSATITAIYKLTNHCSNAPCIHQKRLTDAYVLKYTCKQGAFVPTPTLIKNHVISPLSPSG